MIGSPWGPSVTVSNGRISGEPKGYCILFLSCSKPADHRKTLGRVTGHLDRLGGLIRPILFLPGIQSPAWRAGCIITAMPDNEKILEALKRIQGELRTLKVLAILWTLIVVLIFLAPLLWTLLFRLKP